MTKWLKGAMLAIALLGVTTPAMAATLRVEPQIEVGVGVHGAFDPWAPYAAPVPRAGFVWVGGHPDAWGHWVPGYYRPAMGRPGFVYEPGYWGGGWYHDGYWRPAVHAGYGWVPGHYAPRGWVHGHWARR